MLNLPGIQHGFFTRNGGISQGVYASLNCAYQSKDNPSHVSENRKRAMAHINRLFSSLVTLHDIHSNHVIVVNEAWPDKQELQADGMVTQNKQVTLGALSADCPVVLLADPKAGI